MQPEDIALIAAAGEVALSPDGRRAVYAVTTQDLEANASRTRLWIADTGGGRPRPLSGGRHDRLARWSPDGATLAWVGSEDGRTAIFTLAADGPGTPALLCTWADEITELEWSPLGDRLAFVGRVPDPTRYGEAHHPKAVAEMPPRRVTRLMSRHDGDGWVFDRPTQVHVVAADGAGRPLALTSGDRPASGVAWSPDGLRLAYVAPGHDGWDVDGRNDLWVIEADGGRPARAVTDTTMAWAHPSWSPGGERIAALVDPTPVNGPRHGQLWVVELGDGTGSAAAPALRWAVGYDRNLAPYGASRPPIWAGDELLVAAEDEGRLSVVAVGPPSGPRAGSPRVIVGGERVVSSFDLAGGWLAFTATTVTEPGELWAVELSAGATVAAGLSGERRLSDHSAALRARVTLATPERYVAISADGSEVECWAMAPVGAGGARPAILNIHGGPFTQYGYNFFDEFQLQVGAGFGVVYCNPRGSSGYSEAWGRAIRWPEAPEDPGSGWGGVDVDDVMACVEQAVSRFEWVDGDRLGVQGGSYGGYLTSWIVGHSERFGAAVSERAVNNLLTAEHNSDISGFFKEAVGWTHLERPDLYLRQSPSTYIADMRTPMLMIHSEDDLRCPISQAEELFVGLRLLGREPELVRFPGECHELSRSGSPRHRVQRAEIILEWFDRHLGAKD